MAGEQVDKKLWLSGQETAYGDDMSKGHNAGVIQRAEQGPRHLPGAPALLGSELPTKTISV
jgi:hypothetical protein